MSDETQQGAKIGAGHAAAMARLGLRELRGAMYQHSEIAQQPEQGTYGTLTPGEIADGKKADLGLDSQQEQELGSVLDERMEQACGRDDPERDDKSLEME